jgi:hypothetical protein
MNKIISFLIAFMMGAAILSSCGGKETSTAEASAEEDSFDQARNSIDKAEKAMKDLSEGSGEVVDFRELKAWLPQKVGGLERTSASGESSGAFGFKFSKAEGLYEEGDKKIEVEVIDFGGIQSAMMGMAAWANYEKDAETKDGYEKTKTIQGMKAFEKFNYSGERGEVNLLSENHIINVRTKGLSEKQFQKVTNDLNFKDLEKLKPKK